MADSIIADCDDNTLILMKSSKKSSRITDHMPTAIGYTPRPSIIVKVNLIPATALRGISYYLAMTARPEDRQLFQCLLPLNFDMVTSPAALIPSLITTFLTVMNRIFKSSTND